MFYDYDIAHSSESWDASDPDKRKSTNFVLGLYEACT